MLPLFFRWKFLTMLHAAQELYFGMHPVPSVFHPNPPGRHVFPFPTGLCVCESSFPFFFSRQQPTSSVSLLFSRRNLKRISTGCLQCFFQKAPPPCHPLAGVPVPFLALTELNLKFTQPPMKLPPVCHPSLFFGLWCYRAIL